MNTTMPITDNSKECSCWVKLKLLIVLKTTRGFLKTQGLMSHNMDLQIFQRKHLTKNIIDVSDKNIKITIIFILYIFSIIIVLMFEISVDKIAFETTLAHLSDELFSKEVEITNIELDFSKKFQGLINSPDHHGEMIKYSTKILGDLDKILKDLQYHFSELKMSNVYCIFQKMFKIVIFGYKLLSQAFLLRYRDQKSVNKLGIENKNDYNSKITESKFYTYKSSSQKKDNFKKMEHINFIIDELEKRDKQIEKELKQYLIKVKLQRQMVERMMPSNTVNKIIQIQCDLHDLISRSDEMFENVFKFRHDELKKLFSEVEKPKDIHNLLEQNIKSRVKYGFLTGIQKITKYFEQKFKRKTINRLKKQRKVTSILIEQSFQADAELRKSEQENELNTLKKKFQETKYSLEVCEKQKYSLTIRLFNTQKQLKQVKKNTDLLEGMIKDKDIEIQQNKMEHQWVLKKKNSSIEKLTQKVDKFKVLKQISNKKQFSQASVQTDEIQESEIEVFKQSTRKKSFKKLDLEKHQNMRIRNSLIYIIQKINKLLEIHGQNDHLEKDIKNITSVEELKVIVNDWSEQIQKMRKQSRKKQQELIDNVSNNYLKKRRSILVSKRNSKQNLKIAPQTSSAEVSTQTIPLNTPAEKSPEKQPINKVLQKKQIIKKPQKKVRIPQILYTNKQKLSRQRKQNSIESFFAEEKVKTQREQKHKSNLCDLFKKTTFQQINMDQNRIGSKVRKSKVGIYLTSFSSRNKNTPYRNRQVIVEELDERK